MLRLLMDYGANPFTLFFDRTARDRAKNKGHLFLLPAIDAYEKEFPFLQRKLLVSLFLLFYYYPSSIITPLDAQTCPGKTSPTPEPCSRRRLSGRSWWLPSCSRC